MLARALDHPAVDTEVGADIGHDWRQGSGVMSRGDERAFVGLEGVRLGAGGGSSERAGQSQFRQRIDEPL